MILSDTLLTFQIFPDPYTVWHKSTDFETLKDVGKTLFVSTLVSSYFVLKGNRTNEASQTLLIGMA